MFIITCFAYYTFFGENFLFFIFLLCQGNLFVQLKLNGWFNHIPHKNHKMFAHKSKTENIILDCHIFMLRIFCFSLLQMSCLFQFYLGKWFFFITMRIKSHKIQYDYYCTVQMSKNIILCVYNNHHFYRDIVTVEPRYMNEKW